MKKVSVVLICICYLLSGCSMFGSYMKEPVTFYYVQKDYQEEMQDVIRNISFKRVRGFISKMIYISVKFECIYILILAFKLRDKIKEFIWNMKRDR